MKKFITLLAISIIIVATPACSRVYLSDILPTEVFLTEEAEKKKRIQEMKQRIRAYQKECIAIGFRKGTAEHKHCVKDLNVAYRAGKSSSAGGTYFIGGGSSVGGGSPAGMSFICKQSIINGDRGGIFAHCN